MYFTNDVLGYQPMRTTLPADVAAAEVVSAMTVSNKPVRQVRRRDIRIEVQTVKDRHKADLGSTGH